MQTASYKSPIERGHQCLNDKRKLAYPKYRRSQAQQHSSYFLDLCDSDYCGILAMSLLIFLYLA